MKVLSKSTQIQKSSSLTAATVHNLSTSISKKKIFFNNVTRIIYIKVTKSFQIISQSDSHFSFIQPYNKLRPFGGPGFSPAWGSLHRKRPPGSCVCTSLSRIRSYNKKLNKNITHRKSTNSLTVLVFLQISH